MQFDLFHSIGRIDSIKPIPSDLQVFEGFLRQCREGESMGYKTMWIAESHFSSEVQKTHRAPVIPNYHGEVGLNADSCQLAQMILSQTKTLGVGTAIFNIVGGNGGPIGAADRIRTLSFLNQLRAEPRRLHIGVASGRFPYINAPFGIVPRTQTETLLWPQTQRLIFLEALEIFLRLSNGETLSSQDITKYNYEAWQFKDEQEFTTKLAKVKELDSSPTYTDYKPRWTFDTLKLVPDLPQSVWSKSMNFVLGSHDPKARDLGLRFGDLDTFNLSFTPPEQLNKIHQEMFERYSASGKTWHRSKMPRTVLTFIDRNAAKAKDMASFCFDTYIEAMRGTAVLPPKEELMARALIGDPQTIRDQLHPESSHGFHSDDRLMLWFEFNQVNRDAIIQQMKLFAEEVAPYVSRS